MYFFGELDEPKVNLEEYFDNDAREALWELEFQDGKTLSR